MRQIHFIACFLVVTTLICGCKKDNQHESTQDPAGNVGSETLDAQASNARSIAEALQKIEDRHVNPNSCDEFKSRMAVASQWDCVDGIPVCMDYKGCKADGRLYPELGYLGDKAPRDIPAMPAEFEGYRLIDILYRQTNGWECHKDTCLCGQLTIPKFDYCAGDIYYPNFGDTCGDLVCGRGAGCKDGKCVCGNQFFDVVSKDPAEVKKYRCSDDQLVCSDFSGCMCGTAKCIRGAKCQNGKCFCGNEDVTDFSSDYVCREMKNYSYALRCHNRDGCKCGNVVIPVDSECNGGKAYCHGYPIPADGFADITQYRCSFDEPMLVCNSSEGCTCDTHTCAFGEECYQGECYCGKDKVNDDLSKVCSDGVMQTKGEKPKEKTDSKRKFKFMYEYYGKYKDTNERHCPSIRSNHKSCTDCDALTCEYSFDDDSYHEWACRVYHGCSYQGKSYQFGERVEIESLQNNQPAFCGTELLREQYICKEHQQVCNAAAGCKCGDTTVARNDVCSKDTKKRFKSLKGNAFCACDDKNAEMHCPYKELTEKQFYNRPHTAKCGDKTLYYSLDRYGRGDDGKKILVENDKFDVCCVCLNDDKIPLDFENYVCEIEFKPEKDAINDNIRIQVDGINYVPSVHAWPCRDPQKCSAEAACGLGDMFEYIDENTCRCGEITLDPRSVDPYKCIYGMVVCDEDEGDCTKPDSNERCGFDRVCK